MEKKQSTIFIIIFLLVIIDGFSLSHYELSLEGISLSTPLGLLINGISQLKGLRSPSYPLNFHFGQLSYLKFFVCTFFLEFSILWLFFRRISKALDLSLKLNFITHPFVFFVMPIFISDYIIYFVSAELFAFIVEIFLLFFLNKKMSLIKAFLVGSLMNLVSWQIGPYLIYFLSF